MKKIISLVLLLSVATASGCATMFNQTTQDVVINASQADTQVTVKNKSGETVYEGQAPATLELKRGAGFFQGEKYTVEGSKKGYTTHTETVNATLSGWVFANLLWSVYLAPVAVIIDGGTGGMYNLKPEKVMMQLSSEAK